MYFVCLLTNKNNSVFYTGVTNDLHRRIEEHKKRTFSSFTSKYNLFRLVYYEEIADIDDAIRREKNLKKWKKQWKRNIIEKLTEITKIYTMKTC